jgi:hypothetical protein
MINSIVETVKMHMVLEAFLIGLEKVKEKHQISEMVKLLYVTNAHSWKGKSIQTATALMLSLPKKKKFFRPVPREWLNRNVSREGSQGRMGKSVSYGVISHGLT